MEETNNHPQWLLEIENRKRKPRLAHEAGAGAPCMVCNSACPGLDLHFWRKICKICKCSRDDHDVNDDDFPQFDLLFGPSGKFKKKSILLRVPNKKQNEVETSFEWIPPDTTKDLATDYMKALPIEKLPIKGSAGAALRRQLLQKQLPLHDIDHKACDELSEGEKKQFEKYLDNLKRYVGQGKVIKILGARPFDKSLMTPANATDMQKFSPQHKQVSINSMQLKTPSSLAKQIQHMKTTHENEKRDSLMSTDLTSNQADVLEATNERVTLNAASSNVNIPHELINSSVIKQTANSEDVLLLGSSNTCKSLVGKYNKQKPAVPLKYLKEKTMPSKNDNTFQNSLSTADPITEDLSNIQCHDDDTESSYLMHAENILADALLPPSAIHTDDIIGSTLDEQKLIFIREKLNSKYSMQEAVAGRQMPGISQELGGHSNLKSNVLPKVNNMREKINLPEITANKYILKNPELELACTTTLDNILPANASKLSPYKSSSCNPTSITTMRPSKNINLEESPQTSISTTNEDNNSQVLKQDMYQQNQLPLSTLNIDNTNCLPSKLDKLGCIPTSIIYSDQLQNDVLPHEIINEINQVTPNLCNVNHIKDGIKGLALESIKHQTCEKCHEDIRIGDVAVTIEKAQNVSWHPGCFVCSVCNELLGDLIYFYYKNKLYCGRDLSTLLGIPRCFACDELIFVREYTVAEGHNYHVKHFCCWDCDLPLAGQQYISENDRPLCLPCYQNTYAKTCAACEVIIAPNQQGVFIKNLNFHATETCFCCFICKKNLLNGKMAIKENKLFCSKECIGTFLR